MIVKIREFMARFTDAAMPGNFLVDLFPIMNYLPSWMAPWKREALEWNQSQSNLFEESEADILKRMVCYAVLYAGVLTPIVWI